MAYCPPNQRRNAPAPKPRQQACDFNRTGCYCNHECDRCTTRILARGAARLRADRILAARLMRTAPTSR